MNPEELLHETAEKLQAEAAKGLGTMFVISTAEGFVVTRTPGNVSQSSIVAQYKCQKFSGGLTPTQWATLLKSLWKAHVEKN